ncbi:hypothetical protein [Achromobacter aloeverae]
MAVAIESFTASQDGVSKLEVIAKDAKTAAVTVTYTFELRRLYRGENKLTSGLGELRLVGDGKELKGAYWTNSPTQGELLLRLVSRDAKAIASFEDAERLGYLDG